LRFDELVDLVLGKSFSRGFLPKFHNGHPVIIRTTLFVLSCKIILSLRRSGDLLKGVVHAFQGSGQEGWAETDIFAILDCGFGAMTKSISWVARGMPCSELAKEPVSMYGTPAASRILMIRRITSSTVSPDAI